MWSYVFLAVGLLGIIGAVMYWRRVSAWLATAETTTADIKRLEGGMPGQGKVPANTSPRVSVFPVVRFTDREGKAQEHRARMGAPYGRLKDKKSIEIVYDPKNPEDVRLGKGADLGFAAMLGLLSLLSIGMGLYRILGA